MVLSKTDIVTAFIAIVLLYIRPEYSIVIGCIVVKAGNTQEWSLLPQSKCFKLKYFPGNSVFNAKVEH